MRAITTLFLLVTLPVWAQPSFIRRYELPPNSIVADASATPDGGVVISGHVDGPENEDTYGLLMKLDQGGNIQWSQQSEARYLSSGGWNERFYDLRLGSIVTLANGDIVVAGRAEQRGVSSLPIKEAILAGYASNTGELQWIRTHYNDGSTQTWPGVLALQTNGRVLFTGTQYLVVGNVTTRLIEFAVASGIVTNYVAFSLVGLGVPAGDATSLAGGDITVYPGGGSITIMSGTESCHVVRLTAALDTIWEHQWPTATFGSVTVGTDGNILASGGTVLQQLLPDGSMGWSRTLVDGFGTISKVMAHPSGGYYVLGNVAGANGHSWLAHIASDGTLLWSERYGEAGDGFSLTRSVTLADGTLRLIGRAGNDLLVLGTDSMGQLNACTYPAFEPIFTSNGIAAEDLLTIGGYPGGGLGDEMTDLPVTALIMPSSVSCASDIWVLSGTVFADLNANSLMDLNEPGIPGSPVQVLPENGTVYSLGQGNYQITTLIAGEHTVNAWSNYPWWIPGDLPTTQTMELNATELLVNDIDFGFVPALDTTVVVVGLVSEPTRCDLIVTQTISLMNQGTTEPDLVISVTLDPLTTFVASNPAPDSAIGTTFYWSLEQFGLFQSLGLSLEVQMPDFTAIGASLDATIEVLELTGLGEQVLVATHEWNSTLTCGYDPNDKSVEPSGMGPSGVIPIDTEWLTYTVRFQNTGNDTAFSVVVHDLLDPNLQRGSLQVLSTSHELTEMTMNAGGLVSFHFDNILLPDSTTNEQESHGHVRFRLHLADGLELGTEVTNSASIHFDLNPPVITNTVLNTLQNCALDTFQMEVRYENGELLVWSPSGVFLWDYFNMTWYRNGEPVDYNDNGNCTPELPGMYTVVLTRNNNTGCMIELGPYPIIATALRDIEAPLVRVLPNPFTDQLQVRCEGAHDHIDLMDINGRIVRSQATRNAPTVTFHRGELASGIYLLRVMDGERVVATARVVAE